MVTSLMLALTRSERQTDLPSLEYDGAWYSFEPNESAHVELNGGSDTVRVLCFGATTARQQRAHFLNVKSGMDNSITYSTISKRQRKRTYSLLQERECAKNWSMNTKDQAIWRRDRRCDGCSSTIAKRTTSLYPNDLSAIRLTRSAKHGMGKASSGERITATAWEHTYAMASSTCLGASLPMQSTQKRTSLRSSSKLSSPTSTTSRLSTRLFLHLTWQVSCQWSCEECDNLLLGQKS